MSALGRAIPALAAGPLRLAVLGAVLALGSLAASEAFGAGWLPGVLFLVAAVILAALPVRLPGSFLAFLPGILIPAWLALGLVATALLAPAAALLGGVIRRSRPEPAALGATMALAGVLVGDLGGRALGALGLWSGVLSERIVLGAGFALGSWLAERAIVWLAERTRLAGELRRLPRASLIANLLLAWPAAILVDVLQSRGILLFGLLLAVLVAALVLIALYLGAETARWGAAGERERLQSIVAQVPDGIFTVRPDLTVDWLNDTAAGLTGWQPDDATGRPSSEVVQVHTADGAPVDHLAAFLDAARSGQPVHTRAILTARDGVERTVILSYTSMASATDGLELGIASIREVPADAAAVTADDSREAQLSMLGHELRSPLTAIMGYAGLMRREASGSVDPARQAEYVDRIAASGDYMLRLVNNMLDLRRMESGAEQLQPTPIRLDRMLQVVVGLARLGANEKRIETELSVAPDLPPFVTDELLLRRTIDNLLSNAIKYSQPGGKVRVTAVPRDGGVEIAVTDTGIGITEEDQKQLFDRFFRSSRPEARRERGTGLGLALVSESVRRLGGEITVTSEVGVGSTFTVWLPPLGPSDARPSAPSTPASA